METTDIIRGPKLQGVGCWSVWPSIQETLITDLIVAFAIAEYGVRVIPAKYVMKCDDDTFVRIDSVLEQVKKVRSDKSVYVGSMNYFHRPVRSGKWAVTYEELPKEVYPNYANGPGYVISSDIARYIVSEFDNQTLRMEDVSMGMWVEKFSITRQPVEYRHGEVLSGWLLRWLFHGTLSVTPAHDLSMEKTAD